jgi:uncharacterized protein YehS (DUF1456 family)
MIETTEVFNAQITIITKGELTLTEDQVADWVKKKLEADDVKVSNLKRFEMEINK